MSSWHQNGPKQTKLNRVFVYFQVICKFQEGKAREYCSKVLFYYYFYDRESKFKRFKLARENTCEGDSLSHMKYSFLRITTCNLLSLGLPLFSVLVFADLIHDILWSAAMRLPFFFLFFFNFHRHKISTFVFLFKQHSR